MRGGIITSHVALALLCVAGTVFAQAAPPPPPKIWTVTASAGLAMTSGNSDTVSTNAAYDITYDPQQRNIVKSDGLFLRARTEGDLTANRLGFNVRDQYRLTPRLYVFGQNQYLKDQFKEIDYLVAPTGGLGYKLFDTAATKLDVDGGVGVVWEKNPVSTLTRRAQSPRREAGTDDHGEHHPDANIHGVVEDGGLRGLAVHTRHKPRGRDVHAHAVKIEALDTYKNKPPLPTIQKNDVAVLMAIVYKM